MYVGFVLVLSQCEALRMKFQFGECQKWRFNDKKSGMSQHQSLLPQVSDCCYVENKFREFSPSKAITFIMCFFFFVFGELEGVE